MSAELNNNPSIPWLTAIKNNSILKNCLIASLATNVLLVAGYLFLLPLKEKEIQVLEFSNASSNFVTIHRAGSDLRSNAALISMFLRQYVIDRESVDKITESEIGYPRAIAMSSNKVAEDFKRIYGNPETGPYFVAGLKRAVYIISDSHLAEGVHQVEFKTVDSLDGRKDSKTTHYVATMSYTFQEQKVSADQITVNPMGLVITEYAVKKREGGK